MGRVKVNPKMLKWAREDAGYNYNNLPKSLRDNFLKWESGEVLPTWNQLNELSEKYKRPSAFFFRKTPPKSDKIDFLEFRSKNKNIENSPELNLAIRDVLNKRNIFLELIEDMNYPKVLFSKNIFCSNSVKKFSLYIRNLLNVSLDDQKDRIYSLNNCKDYNHYNFINKWKEDFYNLGILVFEVPRIKLDEMRALCLYFDEYPIILLNGSDSVNGRIFSLFHELTHLLKRETAICDFTVNNTMETFCNNVAFEFLVPSYDLLSESIVKFHKDDFWDDAILSKLSHMYGVSREMILLKLLDLNKTSDKFYMDKKEWIKFKGSNNSKGGGDVVLDSIKYNGKLYSKVLLNAYKNNVLSPIDFSEAIGLKLGHVELLEYYLEDF